MNLIQLLISLNFCSILIAVLWVFHGFIITLSADLRDFHCFLSTLSAELRVSQGFLSVLSANLRIPQGFFQYSECRPKGLSVPFSVPLVQTSWSLRVFSVPSVQTSGPVRVSSVPTVQIARYLRVLSVPMKDFQGFLIVSWSFFITVKIVCNVIHLQVFCILNNKNEVNKSRLIVLFWLLMSI